MIITDTQPYSMVEDKGFLALMKFAFPHYKVPCRNYFVSYIEKLYEEVKSMFLNGGKTIKRFPVFIHKQ
jgi:hypothetical protein